MTATQNIDRIPAELAQRIIRFSELQGDWNSYGATGITPESIDAALDLAAWLWTRGVFTAPDHWVPTSEGGVYLEMYKPFDLQLTVTPDGKHALQALVVGCEP